MKPTLKIHFTDVYKGFDEIDNRFTRALNRRFSLIFDKEKPQVVFYSCFGNNHLKYNNATRVFFNGENLFPNFNICDYSIGALRDSLSGRNLFQPIALYLFKPTALPEITPELSQRKFCSFIYSQDYFGEGAILRKEFCLQLMNDYKRVDCPGKILHNFDCSDLARRDDDNTWHDSKVKFLSQYKFNIAFENTNSDGYITEKLLDPFLANSVPIYWGSNGNTTPFPKDAMICANDFPNINALIHRIKEVDMNDDIYLDMLSKNPLRKKILKDPIDELEAFLVPIFMKSTVPLEKDLGLRDPLNSVIDFAKMQQKKLSFLRFVGKIYDFIPFIK